MLRPVTCHVNSFPFFLVAYNDVPMRHALVAAVLAVTASAASAAAQQAARPADPALRVDVEVVVTPERGESERLRVPGATAVLDGRDIPTLPAAHASELLAALPGFTVIRPQGHAGRPIVSARGFFGGGEA
jgi:outer membrane cobalamin receptor